MNRLKSNVIAAATSSVSIAAPAAQINQTMKEYEVDSIVFKSELIATKDGSTSGLLLVPDWTGINDHARMQARRLAQLGRTVLIVDLYGKDVQTDGDAAKADAASSPMIKDRQLAQMRMQAALIALQGELPIDAKVASVGFSFGALAALELARSGADVAGTIAIWPILGNPTPENASRIRGPVLVLQGTQDVLAPPGSLQSFATEMDTAGKPFEVMMFGGVKHGYTIPGITNTTDNPLASNAEAAMKTLLQMDEFLTRILD